MATAGNRKGAEARAAVQGRATPRPAEERVINAAQQVTLPPGSVLTSQTASRQYRDTLPQAPTLVGDVGRQAVSLVRGIGIALGSKGVDLAQMREALDHVSVRNAHPAAAIYRAEMMDYVEGLQARAAEGEQA